MQRTILIVDDNTINRRILENILSGEYNTLKADNGHSALELLRSQYMTISAVLLDIVMPVLDGYQVLDEMQKDPLLSAIPVIVTTGITEPDAEKKALSLGANDFVTKPFDADIIKRRLENLVRLRESAAMLNSLQRDKLTGLWNRETFFEKAAWSIEQKEAGYYTLACLDIDNFKVVNDQFGMARGDEVLKALSAVLRRECERADCLCGRISADNFAILFPTGLSETFAGQLRQSDLTEWAGIDMALVISAGCYVVTDKSLSVSAMYDRASIAQVTVKGRYDVHTAIYNETMRSHLLQEQEIVSEMNAALREGQFEAWYQPQFNHATSALIGAEALARWRHPQKGLISPTVFIPVFERNGFVYELDKAIWRRVCMDLRRWMDEGRNPLPVSVNISRYDIFRGDLVSTLSNLLEEFSLPVDLLRLEITESAFAQSAEQVVSVVKQFIALGFTVEIDDFGSGYSSLNTLKDVPAQILKLDMRFLENDICSLDGSCKVSSYRGGNILESIVRMAKWLGMSVIAEGVETLQQADYLCSIGCCYIQGYYYARPMPVSEYESFAADAGKEEKLLVMESVANLDNSDFWNPNSMDTLIFNSYVGAACIFEYHNGRSEILRANEKYSRIYGESFTLQQAMSFSWDNAMDEESAHIRALTMERAIKTGEEVEDEIVCHSPVGKGNVYLRSTVRIIASAGERYLAYCTVENISEQKESERKRAEAEKKLRESSEHLRAMMDDTPGGFARMRLLPDGGISTVYVNERFCQMRGMTREKIISQDSADAMLPVHPEDIANVSATLSELIATGETCRIRYRLRRADGTFVPMTVFGRATRDEDGERYINAYFTDMTGQERRVLSIKDTMPYVLSTIMASTSDLSFVKDGELKYICCSKPFLKMVGLENEADIAGKTDYDLFETAVADKYRADDLRLIAGGTSLVDYIESIPSDDGIPHFARTSKYILRDTTGDIVGLYGTGQDITDTRTAYERLKLLTDSIPGGLLSYVTSPQGVRLTYFNEGICRMMGRTREEYQAATKESVITSAFEEDKPRLLEQVNAMLKDRVPVDCTYRIHDRSQRGFRWVNLRVGEPEKLGDEFCVNAVLYDITEQKLADEALLVREAEYRLAIEHSGKLIYRYNHTEDCMELSEKVSELFALPRRLTNVPESLIAEGNVGEESIGAYRSFYAAIRRGEKTGGTLVRRKTADGRWRWFDISFSTVYDAEGAPVSAIIMFEDITEAREEKVAEKLNQNRFMAALGTVYPMLISVNLTRNFYKLVSSNDAISVIGKAEGRIDELLSFAVQSMEKDYARRFAKKYNLSSAKETFSKPGDSLRLEYRQMSADGQYHWLEVTIIRTPNEYSDEITGVITGRFIDAQKDVEEKLKQAELDRMTGIYNKSAATDIISQRLSSGNGETCALLVVDLDNLKRINDTLGHDQGDVAIKQIAKLLRSQFRQSDVVGRMGGDEFVVYVSDVTKPRINSILVAFMRRLSAIRIGKDSDYPLRSSIGVVMGFPGEDSYEALFKRADTALYHVKRNGKDDFAFYTPEMEKSVYHYKPQSDISKWQSNYFNKTELDHLLGALSEIYPLVISINLTQNSYYTLQYENYTTRKSLAVGDFETLVSEGAATFYPSDEKRFREMFSREALLAARQRGERIVCHTGRQLGDDGIYRIIRTELVFLMDEEGSDVLGLVLARGEEPMQISQGE